MGRDLGEGFGLLQVACFNPRARMGRDDRVEPLSTAECSFNPRARMGRDERREQIDAEYEQFQSTRPHGARRYIGLATRR